MKKLLIALTALAALFFVSGVSLAQDKNGKGSQPAQMTKAFMKQLEKAELSSEQSDKIKELFTKAAKEVSTKRTEGGITAEILKKRMEAMKAAREAGKKGKEVQAAVEAAVTLTDAQKKLLTETDELLSKARIEVGKLLKPEQIAKLPDQFQASLKEKESGKKKKK
jgi:septation ring formation regulator EzrA